MKQFIIYVSLFLFVCCPLEMSSKVNLQHAEKLIDRMPKEDPWIRNPYGATFAWGESYTLGAFMDLYEATKDTKYLEIVADRGKRMLTHRDDKCGVRDGSGKSRPAWSEARKYVVAVGALLSTTGEEMLTIRSATSSSNNYTTIKVVRSKKSDKFTLTVRNDERKRYETFNNLDLNFSPSSIMNAINDPLAPYSCRSGNYTDQGSHLIRIEEVKTEVSGVLANQEISLTPIPLAFAGYLGVIYYPLMRFCEIVKEDPLLNRFISDADEFIKAAEESYADISARLWREGPNSGEGYYLMCEKGESMPADNVGAPFNYLAKHVCTELALYKLTDKPQYLERATKMLNLFYNRLTYNEENDLYTWKYWYEPMTTTGWLPEDSISFNAKSFPRAAPVEDISHAGHNIQMIMAAYRAGVVFNETHVKRFANTFIKNVLTPDRKKITQLVDGSGDNQAYFNAIHQWLALAEVNPEVFKAGKEIYENRTEETLPWTAALLKYENYLDKKPGAR